jgi:DNA invertase Pin-like site-specific DNA recombinase
MTRSVLSYPAGSIGIAQSRDEDPKIALSAPPGATALRAAICHPARKTDQDPQRARDELAAWVARQGGTIVLHEEGSRSGLERVLAAARRGELDVVVAWKLDSWGRSAPDVLANIQALAEVGVRFVAVNQGVDIRPGDDATTHAMLVMLAAVVELERDRIRERTMLGLDRARRSGKRLGRPPVDGPSPAEVLALKAQGKSWRVVAQELGCTISVARLRAAQATNRSPSSCMLDRTLHDPNLRQVLDGETHATSSR